VKNESILLQDLHFAIQSPRVIAVIEEITGIKNQVPNRSRLDGAISTLLKGHYINPHLDNSHDVDKKLYQTVNLLYYVSPNWKLENGGNYELWDESIKNRIIVPSLFNRLVVMETNQTSWHAVNPVLCDAARCCIFNYYYSEQPPRGQAYFHTASSLFFNPLIRPRPEQKIRRTIAFIKDALLKKVW
jgi:Rps23 Pro-64 3,4-dihydroxylase Tpa1-like proline 4-hydroxylase